MHRAFYRARAEAGPSWALHAFHAGGCVVAHEHGRVDARVVIACEGAEGVASAWERGAATLLEGRTPGCVQGHVLRARVDGRRLCVDAEARLLGTRHALLRSVRVQPGRWRVLDRLQGASRLDEAVPVRLGWTFGEGWRIAGGLTRRDGSTPALECRAAAGNEEILVQLPGTLEWTITGGGSALVGVGRLDGDTVLTSSFEHRARGGNA